MTVASLNDLTFVMLTYSRQSYALRQMYYLSEFGSNLIVMDGTDRPIEENRLHGLSVKIRYFHEPVGLFERLRKALNLVTTKYVALVADDEFYIQSVVAKCIQELETDKSLVACCGTAIGFKPTKENVQGYDVYPELHGYKVDSESSERRVYSHMENYTVNQIYAICRSKEWICAFKGILSKEFSVYGLSEFQFELYMSFSGKSKVLPELMWLRNMGENDPIRGMDACHSGQTFFDWFDDKKNLNEINELFNISEIVFTTLAEDINPNDAKKIAEKGFEKLHCWIDQQRSISTKIIQIIPRFIRRLLPKSLKKTILFFINFRKTSLLYFKNRENFIDIIDVAIRNEKKGISINFYELNNIKKILLNWNGVIK